MTITMRMCCNRAGVIPVFREITKIIMLEEDMLGCIATFPGAK